MVESKNMTSTKNGKVSSNLDTMNKALAESLAASLNLKGEILWYEKATVLMTSGKISVKGMKATIEEAEKVGSAPTIRASHAQYFADSVAVRHLDGGHEQPLKNILNATIQAKRAYKKDFQAKLDEANSFEAFASAIPSQAEQKREAHHNEAKEADINDLLKALGVALKAKQEIKNIKEAEAVAYLLAKALTVSRGKVAQSLAA
jgi:hypothetical protein